MYEAEIKLRLKKEEEANIREKILDFGFSYLQKSIQYDTYFSSPVRDFSITDEALRVRRCINTISGEEKTLLTYKGPKVQSRSVSRKEIETEIKDGKAIEPLLDALMFEKVREIEKRREYYVLAPITLSIDEIRPLGFFMELEFMTDNKESIPEFTEKLYAIAESLGIETKSYLELIIEKENSDF